MSEILIPYFLILPLGAGLLIPLFSRGLRWLSELLANLATGLLLAISVLSFGKEGFYFLGGWRPPLGISLCLDSLASLVLILINGIGFTASIFSKRYLEQYTGRASYYGLFLLMIGGMNGVVLSGDLFNFYVFLELASISSYALVSFGGEAEELEAGFKYTILSALGSIFILVGIAVLYLSYGSVNPGQLSARMALETGVVNLDHFSLMLLVGGLSVKAGLIPFHFWLPDAHPSAPAPISAMLSGILIKAIGIYGLIRVVFNFYGFSLGFSYLFLSLGVLSMVGGVLLALGQWDFKRMLAYHSISQLGYIILGIGLGTPLGIMGGIYHLINHSVFKSLLFFSAGAVEYRIKTRDLREMGGLREQMPFTSAGSLIGSLSISGVPPFNGFFSKLMIIFACLEARRFGLAVVAVLVSILTLASFVKALRFGFFSGLKEKGEGIEEVPVSMRVAMVILMVGCLGLSLLILPPLREQVLGRVQEILTAGTMVSWLGR